MGWAGGGGQRDRVETNVFIVFKTYKFSGEYNQCLSAVFKNFNLTKVAYNRILSM
jgi:hypothetical protein